MAHCVQLIIGQGAPLRAFLDAWPDAIPVDLLAGFTAVPVGETLYDVIRAACPGAECLGPFSMDPPGLDAALCAATSAGGALAYVETDYFGGMGSQSAGAWAGGKRLSAATATRAINAALRLIGVVAEAGLDEFDTIGLGRRRRMDDYGIADTDD